MQSGHEHITEHEKAERLATVRSSLASQRIEGLEPDSQAVADAEAWARGELSLAEAIGHYKAKLKTLVLERQKKCIATPKDRLGVPKDKIATLKDRPKGGQDR